MKEINSTLKQYIIGSKEERITLVYIMPLICISAIKHPEERSSVVPGLPVYEEILPTKAGN